MKLRKSWHSVVVVAAVAASIAFGGCNTSGCLENRNSLPLAGFYSSSTLEKIQLDSLAVGGVGQASDSLLNTPPLAISQVYLPLRSTTSSTSFYIRYLNKDLDFPELYDTITFDYSSEPRFVSEECGAMYYYRISRMAYTRHLVDSVAITDSLITNTDIERIHIYFRTANPETP